MIRTRPDNPNTIDAWDELWLGYAATGLEHKHGDKPYEIAARLLPGDTVLDVGAGDGRVAQLIKSVRPNVRFEAVDWSPKSVDLLREARREVYSTVHRASMPCDLRELRDPVDVVMCNEMIEHMDDPAATVARCAEMATRLVILTTPFAKAGDDPMHVWQFNLDDVYRLCVPFGRVELSVINGRSTIFAVVWVGRV